MICGHDDVWVAELLLHQWLLGIRRILDEADTAKGVIQPKREELCGNCRQSVVSLLSSIQEQADCCVKRQATSRLETTISCKYYRYHIIRCAWTFGFLFLDVGTNRVLDHISVPSVYGIAFPSTTLPTYRAVLRKCCYQR